MGSARCLTSSTSPSLSLSLSLPSGRSVAFLAVAPSSSSDSDSEGRPCCRCKKKGVGSLQILDKDYFNKYLDVKSFLVCVILCMILTICMRNSYMVTRTEIIHFSLKLNTFLNKLICEIAHCAALTLYDGSLDTTYGSAHLVTPRVTRKRGNLHTSCFEVDRQAKTPQFRLRLRVTTVR